MRPDDPPLSPVWLMALSEPHDTYVNACPPAMEMFAIANMPRR